MANPFDKFLAADERATAGSDEPHNDAWWSRHLDVDHSYISRLRSGDRRIGAKHEDRIFKRLNAYWNRDPERWADFRFDPDEYRRVVPTRAQRDEKEKRARLRKRRAMRQLREERGAASAGR